MPVLGRQRLPDHRYRWPKPLRQTKALVKKNFVHLVCRQWFSTFICAIVLPITLTAVLLNLNNLTSPSNGYGISSPSLVKTLAESLVNGTGDLVFVSNSSMGLDVDLAIRRITESLGPLKDRVVYLDHPSGLASHCVANFRGVSNCLAAVVFEDSPSTVGGQGKWKYTVRIDPARSIRVRFDVNSNDLPDDRINLPLQVAVNSAITNTTFSLETVKYTIDTPEENIKQRRAEWATALTYAMDFFLFLPLVIPIYHVASTITTERKAGLSQLLDVMGAGPAVRVASHVISFNLLYFPFFIVGGKLYSTYIFVRPVEREYPVLWFLLNGMAVINWTVLWSTFFKSPRISAIVIAAITLAIGAFTMTFYNESTMRQSSTLATLAFFSPSSNYMVVMAMMLRFVKTSFVVQPWRHSPLGIEFSPMLNPYMPASVIIRTCWAFLAAQIVLFPILAVAAEWFLHRISFKRREFVPDENSSVAITSSGLRKAYGPSCVRRIFCCAWGGRGKPVVAVDGLDLVTRKQQILCLLGVNGSGKTTTFDVIAGMQSSTAGDVRINAEAAQLGVCPQRNVLFPDLTVEEHVELWSQIKQDREDAEDHSSLIERCDLNSKAKSLSRNLSGGQKRKLQLACMLAGDSKVCLMDEVTTGLDPVSRRAIWDIILAERSKRTMVFTTHFLDEGETLADQIVLVSKGKVICQGSAAELKNRFGHGYIVHVPKPQGAGGAEKLLDIDGVSRSLHQDRVFYRVADSKAAPAVIAKLEEDGQIGVGMAGPTLESVFLRRNTEADETLRAELGECVDATSQLSLMSNDGQQRQQQHPAAAATGLSSSQPISAFKQTRVLFRKRLDILRRFWHPPVLALLVAVLLPLTLKGQLDQSRDSEDPWVYQPAVCDPATARSDVAINASIEYVPSTALMPWSSNNRYARKVSDDGQKLTYGPAVLNATIEDILRRKDSSLTPYVKYPEDRAAFIAVESEEKFYASIRDDKERTQLGGLFVQELTRQGRNVSAALIAYPLDRYGLKAMGLVGLWTAAVSGVSISTNVGSLQHTYFDRGSDGAESFQWVTYTALILTLYTAFFTLYPAFEKVNNIRALELANGVRPLPLWLSHFLADVPIVALASASLTVTIALQFPGMFWSPPHIFLLAVLYGMDALLISYLVSRVPRSQLAAFMWALLVLIIQYGAAVFAFTIVGESLELDEILKAADGISWGLGFFLPVVNLMKGLMVSLNTYRMRCRDDASVPYPSHIYGFGGPILLLAIQFVLLGVLLVELESGNSFATLSAFFRHHVLRPLSLRLRGGGGLPNTGTTAPPPSPVAGDEESGRGSSRKPTDSIVEEVERVDSTDDSTDLLRLAHVTKSFGPLKAVDDISLGLGEGEILALLGPNGAGKTTITKMITGDLRPDSGAIYLRGVDVHKQPHLAKRSLGVCPQFDALDLLTARQHLALYARIKGVPERDVARNVSTVLAGTGLERHADDKKASKLSGGNKRKLSLGIALVGNPDVLVLDEPSSSMDAAAKRIMWRTLAEVAAPGRSLLLTTHSMEEADALATRAAIVSGGRMLALGTTEQLRETHGGGRYHVQLVLKTAPESTGEEMRGVEEWVRGRFGVQNAVMERDSLGGQVKFTVPADFTVPAAAAFPAGDGENSTSASPGASTGASSMTVVAVSGGSGGDEKKEGVDDEITVVPTPPAAAPLSSTIGKLIVALEEAKEEIGVSEYSVTPPTLERVFLNVVKDNLTEEEGKKTPWWRLLF